MGARFLTLAVALLATTGAHAQDDSGAAARGAACSMVSDSLQRLTCFDRAFPRGVDASASGTQAAEEETTAAAPISGTGKWQVTREKSPIDDSPTVLGMLIPEEGQSAGLFKKGLLIRCKENTTSVVVATDDFKFGAETGTITYRIGTAPAKMEEWGMSDNNSAMGLWSGAKAIPFLKELRAADKLAVRTMLQKQVDMTFDVRGVAPIVDEIAAACNWAS